MGKMSELHANIHHVLQEYAEPRLSNEYKMYCIKLIEDIEQVIQGKGKSWEKYMKIKRLIEDNSRGYR